MDSGLKSISSLFSGANKFLIPRYQRLYAWEQSQWKDFWEDISYHNPAQKYFFGTILLKEAGLDADFDVLEVVDGQQRLTTMTIFFCEVIKRLKFLDENSNLSALKSDKSISVFAVFPAWCAVFTHSRNGSTQFLPSFPLQLQLFFVG